MTMQQAEDQLRIVNRLRANGFKRLPPDDFVRASVLDGKRDLPDGMNRLGDWLANAPLSVLAYLPHELANLDHDLEGAGLNLNADPLEQLWITDEGELMVGGVESLEEKPVKPWAIYEDVLQAMRNRQKPFSRAADIEVELISKMIAQRVTRGSWQKLARLSFREAGQTASLDTALGSRVLSVSDLHSRAKRRTSTFKRMRGLPHLAALRPQLVQTDSGRKFKLLEANEDNLFRLQRIALTYREIGDLPFVPKLVHEDRQRLVFEFIDGVVPDICSREFCVSFAESLAALHSCGAGTVPRQAYLALVVDEVNYLQDRGLLGDDECRAALAAIRGGMPEAIKVGTVYSDMKANNFCVGSDGALGFFDVGSFTRFSHVESILTSHRTGAALDRKLFLEVYRSNGGVGDPYGRYDFEEIWGHLRSASYYDRSISRYSRLEFLRRRDRRKWVAKSLSKFRNLLNNSD